MGSKHWQSKSEVQVKWQSANGKTAEEVQFALCGCPRAGSHFCAAVIFAP